MGTLTCTGLDRLDHIDGGLFPVHVDRLDLSPLQIQFTPFDPSPCMRLSDLRPREGH